MATHCGVHVVGGAPSHRTLGSARRRGWATRGRAGRDAARAAAWAKCHPRWRPNSAPAPLQGALSGPVQLGTPRVRPGQWASSYGPRCASWPRARASRLRSPPVSPVNIYFGRAYILWPCRRCTRGTRSSAPCLMSARCTQGTRLSAPSSRAAPRSSSGTQTPRWRRARGLMTDEPYTVRAWVQVLQTAGVVRYLSERRHVQYFIVV